MLFELSTAFDVKATLTAFYLGMHHNCIHAEGTARTFSSLSTPALAAVPVHNNLQNLLRVTAID